MRQDGQPFWTHLSGKLVDAKDTAEGSSAARRSGQSAALMFLDLDHFKNINDSLGHRAGDGVLVDLAARLQAAVRMQDTVARLGGDEFILLLPDADASGATAVAKKILQAALAPFRVGQLELTVTPSMGIAMFPEDGDDLDTRREIQAFRNFRP